MNKFMIMRLEGVFIWANGDKYSGYFEYGVMQGYGRFDWAASGNVYSGEWSSGKATGQGSLIKSDGSKLQGSFYAGKLHGWAHHIWSHGDSASGHFINDVLDGYGKFIWAIASGTSDIPNGFKVIARNDAFNRQYEGLWKNGKCHGVGKLQDALSSGSREYINGEENGLGAIIWTQTDTKYIGEFLPVSSSCTLGMEENDETLAWGRIEFGNGLIYEGETKEFLRYGMGQLSYPANSNSTLSEVAAAAHLTQTAEGHILDVESVLLQRGGRFVCRWENDEPVGEGRLILNNGEVREIMWH